MTTKLSAKTELQRIYAGKLASFLRETRSGWRLGDGQGNQFPLSPGQAEQLRSEGEARLEAMFAAHPAQSWINLIAIVVTLVLAMWLGAELAAPGTVPTAAYLLPCALFAFKHSLAGLELALDFAHLRAELAIKAARFSRRNPPQQPMLLKLDPRKWRWRGWGIVLLIGLGWRLLGQTEFGSRTIGFVGLAVIGGAWIWAGRHSAAAASGERN